MKTRNSPHIRRILLTAWLSLGPGLAGNALAAPSIQSIRVTPAPLVTGQTFTISATASPDVTQATATFDFRPATPRGLEIPLIQQGSNWVGSGLVPADIPFELSPAAGATARVRVSNAAHQRAEDVLHLTVHVESISALFANGILTVTGDNQNNTITASRDA